MILYSRWCALALHTRIKFAEAFGITKKGATQVDSNVLKHDGYLVEDIENALTVEAMQKFLGAGNTDMAELWNMCLDKIEGREVEGMVAPTPKPALKLDVLPPEEAKQFKKEHKARVAAAKKHVKETSTKKNKKNATKK